MYCPPHPSCSHTSDQNLTSSGPLNLYPQFPSLPCHQFFHLISPRRQRPTQFDQLPILVDIEVVFDAHPKVFLGNINSRLDGKSHTGTERNRIVVGVMHVEPDVVAQAVDEVLAQRLAMQILAVSVDVIE